MKKLMVLVLFAGIAAAIAPGCAKSQKSETVKDEGAADIPGETSDRESTKVIGDSFVVINPRINGQWVVANNTDLNVKYICEVRKRRAPPYGTGYVWETLDKPIRGVYVNISSIGGRTEVRSFTQNVIIREVHCLNKKPNEKFDREISDTEISDF